jgi:hypothetical protein
MARSKMAKIQGEGRRNGMTSNDIPDGFVSWEEHYMAWAKWAQRHPEPATAEVIEREGGFNYRQMAELLGHNPVTWELREQQRYAEFQLAPEDAPPDLTAPNWEETPPPRSHIRDGASEQPACEIDDDAPDGLFFFDYAMGPHCTKCFAKMQTWLSNWVELGKKSDG